MGYVHLMTKELSVAVDDDGVWQLRGTAAEKFGLVNEFLGYLADRNFSPRTCRAYAYDLLAFVRWLTGEQLGLAEVNVDVLLRFLTACRVATCIRSVMAVIRDMRRRRSIGGWRRFLGCLRSGRCVTRMRVAQSVAVGRSDCVRAVSVPGCWRTRRSRSRVHRCGSVNRAGCRAVCRGRSLRRCWAASVAGVTERSVG